MLSSILVSKTATIVSGEQRISHTWWTKSHLYMYISLLYGGSTFLTDEEEPFRHDLIRVLKTP